MSSKKTPLEINSLRENIAARITVQRITVVISRRRKIFAFEGVGTATSDIRSKLTGGGFVANSQLPHFRRPTDK